MPRPKAGWFLGQQADRPQDLKAKPQLRPATVLAPFYFLPLPHSRMRAIVGGVAAEMLSKRERVQRCSLGLKNLEAAKSGLPVLPKMAPPTAPL